MPLSIGRPGVILPLLPLDDGDLIVSKVQFARDAGAALGKADAVLFIAPRSLIRSGWLDKVCDEPWLGTLAKAAKALDPQRGALQVGGHVEGSGPGRAAIAVLPDSVSRHNSPLNPAAIEAAARASGLMGAKRCAVVLGLADKASYLGAANAVGRSLPLFSRKSGGAPKNTVVFAAADAKGKALSADRWVKESVNAARWAASTVDMPTAELTTAAFVKEARKLVRGLPVKVTDIAGPKLLEKKLGGIHAVGRTAMVPPRLLILDYNPKGAQTCVALVGKGIVYDTGGLSLKGKTGMPGMKSDMGGAAACTGAFRVLAANAPKTRVVALIPLAENAIGPNAYRNDDILTMHSGKTVEINNTDAEGRIVLADAVSYAARVIKADAIVDAATLTGAQLVTSGLRHASVASNRAGLESLSVSCGLESGDTVHPMLFCPELLQSEFASKVADMKNSVANRANAQAACAAQFIHEHIADLDRPWLHIDLAGPAFIKGRGTGYGVALISSLVRQLKPGDLKN